jgi:3-oxoacyl-[acyl-carrier-protein] synthase-3
MVRDRYSVIVGTGRHVPSRRVVNQDFLGNEFFKGYGEVIDPASNSEVLEKFEGITEISERRYVTDDQVTSDIAGSSAEEALRSSGIDRETLDYIIVAHNFGDIPAANPRTDMVPSLAARVKMRLGIRNPKCVAYDLPFGCPGWLQGVIQADYFLRSGDATRAMVIGAETLSRVSDPHDRDGMLYSDGAGCAILEARSSAEPVGVLSHAARSDTLEHASLMWMGASYNPDYEEDSLFLKMQGHKLYEYAVTTVPGFLHETVQKAGLTLADVDKMLMHQANARLNQKILRRLFRLEDVHEIPEGIMPMTISTLGNSSVATIPTLLDLVVRDELDGQRLKRGDIVVFAAVGAGMNINALVYKWD